MSKKQYKDDEARTDLKLTPLHEHFREYTAEELLRIKHNHCVAHKCPYLSKISWASKHRGTVGSNKQLMCNYILVAGHSRGCMPDVCAHWADKGVKAMPSNRQLFNKENHL